MNFADFVFLKKKYQLRSVVCFLWVPCPFKDNDLISKAAWLEITVLFPAPSLFISVVF